MSANDNPAQVSINAPSTEAAVYVRVYPPDTSLDINITAEGEALEVLVTPRGRSVQVRVGPTAGATFGGPGPTGVQGPLAAGPVGPGPPDSGPLASGPSAPSPADSALLVDSAGLTIDEGALESLSSSTDVGPAQAPLEAMEPPRGSEILEPGEAEISPPAAPAVYRDRDGGPPPAEVLESLAQLADPEPVPPRDDPQAATDRLGEIASLFGPASPAVEAAPGVEPELAEEAAGDLVEDWPGGPLAEPLEALGDFSLDDVEEPRLAGAQAGEQGLSLAAAVEPGSEDLPAVDLSDVAASNSSSSDFPSSDFSSSGLSSAEVEPVASSSGARIAADTNFDQPNAERLALAQVPRPGQSAPDSSTAVIVNYLEDTVDSFFEVEGQARDLSEEEDMDIDLLEQGANVAVLAAKPMIPVPRKAL